MIRQLLATAFLALALSSCSAHDIGASILGGAKNWCRHSGGICHVDSVRDHALRH